MNTKQLIDAVNECVSNHWQNSDLPRNVEVLLEVMAKHFEVCEDCQNDFDLMKYESHTLIDFSSEMHLSNTKLEDWTCQKTIQGYCENCNNKRNLLDTDEGYICMVCGEISTALKIYENGKVVELIDENKIDWLPDANYGGAWIGSERLLGWVTTSQYPEIYYTAVVSAAPQFLRRLLDTEPIGLFNPDQTRLCFEFRKIDRELP